MVIDEAFVLTATYFRVVLTSIHLRTGTLALGPAARGSFPLDHGGQCKAAADAYLACIRSPTTKQAHFECKDLSRSYLECRMNKNLMAPEDLGTLGFSAERAVVPPVDDGGDKSREPIIAGLAGAKKAKGGFLGISLPGSKQSS